MKTYSVFLRAFEENDYVLINKWRNNPEMHKYTAGPIRFVSLEIEKEWVKHKMMENYNELYLAICLNDESKKMIGYTSINNIDHLNKKAIFGGIVIGEIEYRDGLSFFETELIKMEYVFDQLNLNRVEIKCLPEHPISSLMIRTFGYKKEGVFRDYIFKNGQYHDLEVYSILRHEYEDFKSQGYYKIHNLVRIFRNLTKKN